MPFSVFFRNPLIQLALWKIRKKHESQPYLLIRLFNSFFFNYSNNLLADSIALWILVSYKCPTAENLMLIYFAKAKSNNHLNLPVLIFPGKAFIIIFILQMETLFQLLQSRWNLKRKDLSVFNESSSFINTH